MKIAVTGASGHVGINLVKKLVQLGHDVRVLVFNGTKLLEELEVEKIKGDLRIIESLFSLCEGVEVVFHLAALISIGNDSEKTVYSTNVDGTKNLVTAAKKAGVKKLIHFSSIHALIHEPFDIEMDESRAIAVNSNITYERTKAIADQWVLQQQSNDFDIVIMNPTSIIGPEDNGPSLMGEFICMVYQGRLPGIVSGGYDWVDVRDIVDASIAAIDKGRGGERYLLSGSWLSIKDFADILISVSNKKRKIPVLPLWLARIGIPFLHIYAKVTNTKPIYTRESLSILQSGNRLISSNKAQIELGFNTRPLKETLSDTYLWFKENNYF
ncbi:MAG: NAD-dependent epimerase/dehydratase family protein [Bacteroidetes bacterium]|nr:NAD-dependent epimerase/dehydratase family protein [Bacteroidota bacterium]